MFMTTTEIQAVQTYTTARNNRIALGTMSDSADDDRIAIRIAAMDAVSAADARWTAAYEAWKSADCAGKAAIEADIDSGRYSEQTGTIDWWHDDMKQLLAEALRAQA